MKKIVLLVILCVAFSGCFKTPQATFDVQDAIKKSMANFVDNATEHKYKDTQEWVLLKIGNIDRDFEIALDIFEEKAKKEVNPIKSMRVWISEEIESRDMSYKEVRDEAKRRLAEFNKTKQDYYNAQQFMDAMDRWLRRKVITKDDFKAATDLLIKKLTDK